MKANMSTTDKFVRVLIGILIAVLYYLEVITDTTAIVVLAIGIVLLLTSLLNFCPLYSVFGIRTNKKEIHIWLEGWKYSKNTLRTIPKII